LEGEVGFEEAEVEEEKVLEVAEGEDSGSFYNRCKVYGLKSTPPSPLEHSSEYWFQFEDYQKEVGNDLKEEEAESLSSFLVICAFHVSCFCFTFFADSFFLL
jgi:hypothetical protein